MKSKIDLADIKHIAIIMDGNGRWAKNRGLTRVAGHEKGADALRNIVRYAGEIGLDYLSVFAFSTENWKRPKIEVDALMGLLLKFCKQEAKELKKNNCSIAFIGDMESMPQKQLNAMREIEAELSNCTGLKLCVFMNYGARLEILNAIKTLAKSGTSLAEISEEDFSKSLLTAKIPDPDLLIRTSGEQRISNFLLWQLAYSELYFSEVYWPDFAAADLDKAIEEYKTRTRRFGGL